MNHHWFKGEDGWYCCIICGKVVCAADCTLEFALEQVDKARESGETFLNGYADQFRCDNGTLDTNCVPDPDDRY